MPPVFQKLLRPVFHVQVNAASAPGISCCSFFNHRPAAFPCHRFFNHCPFHNHNPESTMRGKNAHLTAEAAFGMVATGP